MADSTRRLIIEVDINGGAAALRTVRELGAATDNLSNAQNNNLRAQQTLGNENVNNTRRFSEQQRSMSGLVKTYAVTAANIFALSSAFSVLRENANLQIMIKSSEQLSKTTGINFGAVAKNLQDITAGALGMKEAFQAAALGTAGGASVDQLNQITTVATKAAHALGRSVPDAVSRMVQAVTKAEPELVDEFGIILRMSEASDKYARSVGKTAKELNTLEKQQALINQLLEQGNKKFKDVTLGEENVNQYDRLAVSLQNLSNSVLSFVSGPISSLAGFFSNNSLALATAFTGIGTSILKSVIPSFKAMGDSFTTESNRIHTDIIRTRQELEAYNRLRAERREDRRISGTSTVTNALQRISATGLQNQLPSLASSIRTGQRGGTILRAFEENFPVEEIKKKLREASNSMERIVVTTSEGVINISNATARALVNIAEVARENAVDQANLIPLTFKQKALAAIEEYTSKATGTLQGFKDNLSGIFADIRGGLGAVFSAETTAGGLDALYEHVAKMKEASLAAVEGTGELPSAWDGASQRVTLAVGRIGVAIRGLGAAMDFLMGPIGIVIAAFELLKVGAEAWVEAFGTSTKEMKAADATISTLTDGYEDLHKSIAGTTDSLMVNATSMQDLVDKYTLLGNTVQTISGEISQGLGALKNVRGVDAGFLTKSIRAATYKLFDTDLGSSADAIKQITLRLQELAKVTGKPIDLKIDINGEVVNLLDKLTTAQLNYVNSAEGRLVVERKIKEQQDEIIKSTIEYTGAMKDLTTASNDLAKAQADRYTQFIQNNPIFKEIQQLEALTRGLQTAKKNGTELEAVLAVLDGASAGFSSMLGFDENQKLLLKGLLELRNTITKLRADTETPATRYNILKQYSDDAKEFLQSVPKVAEAIDLILQKQGFPQGGELQISQLSDQALTVQQSLQQSIDQTIPKMQKLTDIDKQKLSLDTEIVQTLKSYEDRLQQVNTLREQGVLITSELKTATGAAVNLVQEEFRLQNEILKLKIQQKNSDIKQVQKDLPRLEGFPKQEATSKLAAYTAELDALWNETKNYTSAVEDLTVELEYHKLSLKELETQYASVQKAVTKAAGQSDISGSTKALDELTAKQAELQQIGAYRSEELANIAAIEGQIAGLKNNELAVSKSQLDVLKQQDDIEKSKVESAMLSLHAIESRYDIESKLTSVQSAKASNLEKQLSLLDSIASNENMIPTARNAAINSYMPLLTEQVKVRDEAIKQEIKDLEVLKANYDTYAATVDKTIKDTEKYKKIDTEITAKQLEQQALYIANAEKIYEQKRLQNEINKQMVDQGFGDFNKTFRDSMSYAANDFAKTLGTTVDRVVKQVIGTINATVDTLFSNITDLIKGVKTSKEAIQGIADDMSKFFLDSAMENAKNTLKLSLMNLFGSGIERYANPQEKSADYLEKIYNQDKAYYSGQSVGSLTAPGNTPNLGSNMFTDIWSGIKEIPSIIGSAFDSISGFFGGSVKKFASGGIVSSSTIANVGEAGPEAVIPLASGAVPVQLAGDTSQATINALVSVGTSMDAVVSNSDEQLAAMKAWDMSINTIGNKIITQINLGTSQIVKAIQDLQFSATLGSGISAVASGISSIASLVSSASSAYNASSGSGSGTSNMSNFAQDAAVGGIFPGLRRMSTGGVATRPEMALIGEGRNNEAVVPMPNNRSIPVQFVDKNGNEMGKNNSGITVNVNVFGVKDEGGLNRSANQIALESARAAQRAIRRDG